MQIYLKQIPYERIHMEPFDLQIGFNKKQIGMSCWFKVSWIWSTVFRHGHILILISYILNLTLLFPLRYEQISIPGASVIAIGAENQFFAIRRKHREGIKAIVATQFFQPAAIYIYHI